MFAEKGKNSPCRNEMLCAEEKLECCEIDNLGFFFQVQKTFFQVPRCYVTFQMLRREETEYAANLESINVRVISLCVYINFSNKCVL